MEICWGFGILFLLLIIKMSYDYYVWEKDFKSKTRELYRGYEERRKHE